MREETTFSAPVREVEVVGAGAVRASTCVDALSHRPQKANGFAVTETEHPNQDPRFSWGMVSEGQGSEVW